MNPPNFDHERFTKDVAVLVDDSKGCGCGFGGGGRAGGVADRVRMDLVGVDLMGFEVVFVLCEELLMADIRDLTFGEFGIGVFVVVVVVLIVFDDSFGFKNLLMRF
jgi:hypothetical protein